MNKIILSVLGMSFFASLLACSAQKERDLVVEKSGPLAGKRVAILATDGVEQVELTGPRKAFSDAGAKTFIVSPLKGTIQAMNHHEKGERLRVDLTLSQASADNFDALLLPGGVANPDALRGDEAAVAFVKHFVDAGKPIAAICHGPWTLIEAGAVVGRKMTSWPTLKTDLINAGAEWVDAEVVTDHGLVTSRKPLDIPAFNKAAIEEMIEGRHEARILTNPAAEEQ